MSEETVIVAITDEADAAHLVQTFRILANEAVRGINPMERERVLRGHMFTLAAHLIETQAVEIARLTAERDAAFVAGAEAMREGAIQIAADLGGARWHGFRVQERCDECSAAIRALPIPAQDGGKNG